LIVVPRVVALGPERFDLLDGEAEDEDIVGADLLADLDVGTVERADGQRAVERMSFMLPVPEASLPAVEICSERSAAGMIFSASETR